MASSSILCKSQLQKLSEHKYSAQGSSISEPLLQPFWRYVVELMPLWLAPNAITILGLFVNIVTSVYIIYLCPTAVGEVWYLHLIYPFINASAARPPRGSKTWGIHWPKNIEIKCRDSRVSLYSCKQFHDLWYQVNLRGFRDQQYNTGST